MGNFECNIVLVEYGWFDYTQRCHEFQKQSGQDFPSRSVFGLHGSVKPALQPERDVDQPDHHGYFHQRTDDRRKSLT